MLYAIAAIVVAALLAFLKGSSLVQASKDRKAGSDATQVEANNAENNRITQSADASTKLPDVKSDSNNLDRP